MTNKSRTFAKGARPDWPKYTVRNINPGLWARVIMRAKAESHDGAPHLNAIMLHMLELYAAAGLPTLPGFPTSRQSADPIEATSRPTADPSVSPTSRPTPDPTVSPTVSPSADPTVSPKCGATSGLAICDREVGHDGPHGCYEDSFNKPSSARRSWWQGGATR